MHGEEGANSGETPLQVSISYLENISPAPDVVFVTNTGGAFVVDPDIGKLVAGGIGGPEVEATYCGTGSSVSNPSAKPGYLCFFVDTQEEIAVADFLKLQLEEESALWTSPAPETGAVVPFILRSEIPPLESPGGYANGSWAVNRE